MLLNYIASAIEWLSMGEKHRLSSTFFPSVFPDFLISTIASQLSPLFNLPFIPTYLTLFSRFLIASLNPSKQPIQK